MYIKPINRTEYQSMVAAHPAASVFHSTDWLDAVSEVYRVRIEYFGLYDGAQLQGAFAVYRRRVLFSDFLGVPLPQVATPLHIPPLIPSGTEAEFITAVDEWICANGISHFQLSWHGDLPALPVLAHAELRDNLELDLHLPREALWKQLSKGAKSSVRHAVHREVRLHWVRNEDCIERYAELLDSTYRKQGLKPNFPLKLYRLLRENLMGEGKLRILVATWRGMWVATAWLLYDPQRCYYWDGASLQEKRDLSASHLMIWEAILWAKRSGLAVFDMVGRARASGRSGARPGIGRFKRSLGASSTDYYVIFWQSTWLRTALQCYRVLLSIRNRSKQQE